MLEDLSCTEDRLQALDIEHSNLRTTIELICDRMRIPQSRELFAPTSQMALIVGRISELEDTMY